LEHARWNPLGKTQLRPDFGSKFYRVTMPLSGHRHERIAEEIQHEVVSMLEGELRDPRLETNVTVTEVRVAPDMKQARVYITIEGAPEERSATLEALRRASGFIRHELVERIQMRRSPEILFVLDESVEQGRRIDELLGQVRAEENPPNSDSQSAPSAVPVRKSKR
jgi:ribosome-binding factor A